MLISIQDLDVFYGPIQALYNVNLEVEQGEIVAIVGNMVPVSLRCSKQFPAWSSLIRDRLFLMVRH